MSNRDRLKAALRQAGEGGLTRAQLAQALDMTSNTVSQVLADALALNEIHHNEVIRGRVYFDGPQGGNGANLYGGRCSFVFDLARHLGYA